MLGKLSGKFGNFSLLGKVINVDYFSFLPKTLGILKNPKACNFLAFWGILILLNNYRHLIDVEDNFHFCPKILGIPKISSCLKTIGQFEKQLPSNFGQILKVIFLTPSLRTIPGAQSHENQYVGYNNIRTNVLHP
jgi:hypothetical protein